MTIKTSDSGLVSFLCIPLLFNFPLSEEKLEFDSPLLCFSAQRMTKLYASAFGPQTLFATFHS